MKKLLVVLLIALLLIGFSPMVAADSENCRGWPEFVCDILGWISDWTEGSIPFETWGSEG